MGAVYIGLALSDPLNLIAQSFPTLRRKNLQEDLEYLIRLVREKGVEEIVVGLPRSLQGGEGGKQRAEVEEFSQQLSGCLKMPVVFWDERFTTKIALDHLKLRKRKPSREKGLADQVAAVIILQSFLDHKNRKGRNDSV